ncbi:ARL14 effector protein [Euwallacea similis]|uniref:ARL14 effector protein n=1 Tax=Euwallacea similis TaxID=1736056 RepID=UPI00344C9AA5
MGYDSSDEDYSPGNTGSQRTARKSTASSSPISVYSTRRKAARNASKAISASSSSSSFDKSMESFNPDMSQRERRKISKKFTPPVPKKPTGAVYDEKGIHVATGLNMCDCLNEKCQGCWFECIKCESTKCGPECRVFRKFTTDSIEYHGHDKTVKNPLLLKS